MTHLRFRLLGPMEIRADGRAVGLPGPAERALLAQLLLSPGRTLPATILIDRLWSESSLPADPVNALQIRVSKLRRSLAVLDAPDLVRRDGAGYRAEVDPGAVDAVDFAIRVARARADRDPNAATPQQLAAYDEALALWQGEPLSDFAGDAWALVEAGRLVEVRMAALVERAQLALALGRHLEVVADLEPLVAADPTQESFAGLLMTALYRSDRQADALAVYTRTRQVLDESLGLEPSLSLRSLHERVLRQDEALTPATVPDVVPVAVGSRRRLGAAEKRSSAGPLRVAVRPLIGRDEMLGTLPGLLAGSRLLTLIGPGGAGKTVLAEAVAASVAGDHPDGAFMVRLASLDEPSSVPLAVAEAVGVPLDGAAPDDGIFGRLVGYLQGRQALLVVDNCEHVIDGVAALVDEVLGRCPEVTVLATSREALAVPQEVQVTVGPLEVPPEGEAVRTVSSYPAVQLFLERARAVRPGTPFAADDLTAVAAITRALDGIPLAVELAAARTGAMSPIEIAARLPQRFSLLTTGARTAEARQQTLRATVDWSYALLSDAEQRVFDRLAVFRGGWTLSSAEAVLADPELPAPEVVDTVGRLVERSMLVAERGDSTTRYRMLETLRQYAAERLEQTGATALTSRRHADHFRSLASDAAADLRGRRQREAFRQLREEQPNLRAALAWLSGPNGDLDAALEMAGSLGLFWHLGQHLEGREVLAGLLARQGGGRRARASALQAVSLVERPRACLAHPSPRCADAAAKSLAEFEAQGDRSRAALSRLLLAVEGVAGHDPTGTEELLTAAERQFAQDEDAWGQAVVGFVRMEMALKRGDAERALTLARATAGTFRRLDDPWGLSATLYHLGWGLRQFGRLEEGSRTLEEAVDVAEAAGLFNTVQWALADLAVAQVHLGNLGTAEDLLARAAAASAQVGDGAGAVLAAYGRGLLAQVRGDFGSARDAYDVALAGFDALGTPVQRGLALAGLARCDEAEGDWSAARAGYDAALQVSLGAGEPGLTATALEGLARCAMAGQDAADARRLLDEARRVRADRVRPAPPHERADLDAALAAHTAG